jgi:uncharacterized protein
MTNRSRRQLIPAAAALGLAAMAPAGAQTAGAKYKVVFQVSDADPHKWNLTLNNAKNVANDLGAEAVELEIVAYGPGIGMLQSGSQVAERVAQARKDGVKVVACENTMKAQKLVYADMLPEIGFVPSGVVELMRKQREGFAYIRP